MKYDPRFYCAKGHLRTPRYSTAPCPRCVTYWANISRLRQMAEKEKDNAELVKAMLQVIAERLR